MPNIIANLYDVYYNINALYSAHKKFLIGLKISLKKVLAPVMEANRNIKDPQPSHNYTANLKKSAS